MEWAINYEKHRDIIRREIVDIESSVDEYDLKINYQEKNKFILVMPVLANIEDADYLSILILIYPFL